MKLISGYVICIICLIIIINIHQIESNAEKCIETYGKAMQAFDAPSSVAIESSIDNGMIALPKTKVPKQNVKRKIGCDTFTILLDL